MNLTLLCVQAPKKKVTPKAAQAGEASDTLHYQSIHSLFAMENFFEELGPAVAPWLEHQVQ